MSNLGAYQIITTVSKKVGGPKNLLAIVLTSGCVLGCVLGSVVTNVYRNIKDKKSLKTLGTYSVIKDAKIEKINLNLKVGDYISVLAADEDSILITKRNDKNNPYFVSADFLMECSDYKRE